MPDDPTTATVWPIGEPSDTLTFNLLRRMERQVREALAIPPPLLVERSTMETLRRESYRRVREAEAALSANPLFNGSMLASYLGTQILQAPSSMYRPPEKPFRSRPQPLWWRPRRKRVRAERVRIRGQTLVSWRGWKGRKVPNRTGYPRSTVFMLNPSAILNPWPVA